MRTNKRRATISEFYLVTIADLRGHSDAARLPSRCIIKGAA
jgi:hypothetical protein